MSSIKVALFIPCYIDQFYPQVGISTMHLLHKFGVEVAYPVDQTCCGQPMANAGCEQDSMPVYQHFIKTFSHFDFIVAPSSSCVYHIKKHYDIVDQSAEAKHVRRVTYELTDFLTTILGVYNIGGHFNSHVGLHIGCHGQRGLRHMTSTEMSPEPQGILTVLLNSIQGLTLTSLNRKDECCGFGGTFCVTEEAVSSRMGLDRVHDHEINGTQILTGTDMSCLMHLEGLIRRNQKSIRVMHVAEIFNEALS